MRLIVRMLTVVLLLLGMTAGGRAQQGADAARMKQQLVGSYKLVSFVNYDEKGTATKSPYSIGQISYDTAGRMSAQLMREGRVRFSGPQASDAERAAAYSGYIAYFGHYTIDPDKKAVTHHVEGGMSPNMVGAELVRYVEFSPDGKSLFLSVKNGERVSGKLQWDRY